MVSPRLEHVHVVAPGPSGGACTPSTRLGGRDCARKSNHTGFGTGTHSIYRVHWRPGSRIRARRADDIPWRLRLDHMISGGLRARRRWRVVFRGRCLSARQSSVRISRPLSIFQATSLFRSGKLVDSFWGFSTATPARDRGRDRSHRTRLLLGTTRELCTFSLGTETVARGDGSARTRTFSRKISDLGKRVIRVGYFRIWVTPVPRGDDRRDEHTRASSSRRSHIPQSRRPRKLCPGVSGWSQSSGNEDPVVSRPTDSLSP